MFGFDLDAALFAGEVMAEARPWPVLGFLDEAAFDRVAVDVSQLLHVLLVSQDVEVIVPGLPELSSFAFEELGGLGLEDSYGCGQRVELRFGEEQVDVLGHDDVAEEEELVSLADSFEGFFEDDAGVVVVEIREPVVTTEVDGVVVALGLVSLQTARH
jgi:hypothetical protein